MNCYDEETRDMIRKMKVLCRAQPRNHREHLVLFLFGLAGLVDSLVVVGTLGYVSCELKGWIMFSGWVDNYLGL